MTAPPEDERLTLRPADRTDDAGIRAVIAAAFDDNPKTDPSMTEWQYWNNPFGDSRAWVWEAQGTIVATYVAFPLPMLLDGKPMLGSSGVDAAFLPEYQGRRLFRPLAEALYADCGEHGLHVTLCFATNPAAIKGIASAGWVGVDELRLWVLAVDDRWVARRFRVPRTVASALRAVAFGRRNAGAAEQSPTVPDAVSDLWNATARHIDNGVLRDGAWWQWRYGAHPQPAYRFVVASGHNGLRGAAVTTVREAFGGRFVYVLELMAVDDAAAATLGNAIADIAVDEGAAGAALLALPGDRVEHLAREAGFRRLPRRLVPRPTWYGAVPNTPQAPDPATTRWSFSWGDLDHL